MKKKNTLGGEECEDTGMCAKIVKMCNCYAFEHKKNHLKRGGKNHYQTLWIREIMLQVK